MHPHRRDVASHSESLDAVALSKCAERNGGRPMIDAPESASHPWGCPCPECVAPAVADPGQLCVVCKRQDCICKWCPVCGNDGDPCERCNGRGKVGP